MSKSQLMDLPWSGSPLATPRSPGLPRYLAVFLLNLSECYRIRVSFECILLYLVWISTGHTTLTWPDNVFVFICICIYAALDCI